ncbi:MAG: hypothetical protein DBX44_06445 [Oscillospiraceae bacterium]|nr:MAG: hypothetical protein DBX44_06445 [Oscillospiraceae bacterium]
MIIFDGCDGRLLYFLSESKKKYLQFSRIDDIVCFIQKQPFSEGGIFLKIPVEPGGLTFGKEAYHDVEST